MYLNFSAFGTYAPIDLHVYEKDEVDTT